MKSLKKLKNKGSIMVKCEHCTRMVVLNTAHVYDGYLFCPDCWTEYCIRHKIGKDAHSSKESNILT